MQIHELDTYIGTPSDSDFLAVDDGTETTKIPITDVGITTEMTQAEAETGTETAPRVVSPAVLNSSVKSIAHGLFVTEEHLLTDSLSIENGNLDNTNYTVTKAGYFPVAFCGWRLANGNGRGGSYGLPFGIALYSASEGEAVIRAGIRAVGNVTNCSLYVNIMWMKLS